MKENNKELKISKIVDIDKNNPQIEIQCSRIITQLLLSMDKIARLTIILDRQVH